MVLFFPCFFFFLPLLNIQYRSLHIYPIGQEAERESLCGYFERNFGKITLVSLDKAHASARIQFETEASMLKVKEYIATTTTLLAQDCPSQCTFCKRTNEASFHRTRFFFFDLSLFKTYLGKKSRIESGNLHTHKGLPNAQEHQRHPPEHMKQHQRYPPDKGMVMKQSLQINGLMSTSNFSVNSDFCQNLDIWMYVLTSIGLSRSNSLHQFNHLLFIHCGSLRTIKKCEEELRCLT